MAGRGGKTSTSGQGRKKGVPNKATQAAREAIALFVDNNAHRLQEWLDSIARGRKADKRRGIKALPGDPEKAFGLFQSVIEYHVPKLARTDLTSGGKALPASVRINVKGV